MWVNRENLEIAFELPRRAMARLNPNHLTWISEEFISKKKMLVKLGCLVICHKWASKTYINDLLGGYNLRVYYLYWLDTNNIFY